MRTTLILSTLLVLGCTAPVDDPLVASEAVAAAADCGPDEGLEVVDGEVVHGISQCALCRRFELAYEAQAVALGCAAPFPSGACVDEGLEDCHVGLVDEWADFSWATSCEQLEGYATDPETYAGFICGDSCETTVEHRLECCPGTPYALRDWRACPYWCDGLSQCNAIPECEALLEERGPRR